MVDFRKYTEAKPNSSAGSFVGTFERLDRKASHIDLRPVQRTALESLQVRRSSRDHVVRLSTGSGKTAVGLVYLHARQRESRRPVVYLCPTTQLVSQVADEAARLGIQVAEYPAGETHPPPEGVSGEAILICTYAKLFNGRSTFRRDDVDLRPYAFVLDDAHMGAQVARDAFTVRATGQLYEALRKTLAGAGTAYKRSHWERITADDPTTLLELPYWVWHPLLTEVRRVIESHDGEHEFAWANIRDHLHLCRCVASGTSIELVPDAPLVSLHRSYADANHRMFMSATLPDEGALTRDLGCEPDAASTPIQVTDSFSNGERMVLAPSLLSTSLDRTWIIEQCKTLSTQHRVVVLCSSSQQQDEWAAAGAVAVRGGDVAEAVQGLREGKLRFVAFAQRYDGMDLPDEACRVLVVDGIPKGQSLVDSLDAVTDGYPGGRYSRWAFRLEQGMGRAVRSNADYCVVLLAGHDLASFAARHEVLDIVSPGTRTQLQLARTLADIGRQEGKPPATLALEMAQQCLSRDPGWKDFYREQMRAATSHAPKESAVAVKVAAALYRALQQAAAGKQGSAIAEVSGVLKEADAQEPSADLSPEQYGWLLQLKAILTYSIDPGEALKIQAAAFARNASLLAPPTRAKKREGRKQGVGATILTWYQQFSDGYGAQAAVESMLARLSFSCPASTFEAALEDLAPLLGAKGERPEKKYGRGPDDLFTWPSRTWVIEAKTGKETLELHKGDGEQLLAAMEWHRSEHPERVGVAEPLVVANTRKVARDAYFPEGTRVLTQAAMDKILHRVQTLVARISTRNPAEWEASQVETLALECGIDPSGLAGALEPLR